MTGKTSHISLKSINNEVKNRQAKRASLTVQPNDRTERLSLPEVYVVDSRPITPNKVPKKDTMRSMLHLKDLSFPEAKEALLLIGLDAPDAFIVEEVRRWRPFDPVAFKVLLGWALPGPISHREDTVFPVNFAQTSDQYLFMKVWSACGRRSLKTQVCL